MSCIGAIMRYGEYALAAAAADERLDHVAGDGRRRGRHGRR